MKKENDYNRGFELGVKVGKTMMAEKLFCIFSKGLKAFSEENMDNAMLVASTEGTILKFIKKI
jgi:hypothetical protein